VPELFLVVLIVAVIGAIAAVAIGYQRKADAAWRTTAERLGLAYHPGGLRTRKAIRGEYGGFDVRVERIVQSTGQSSSTRTRFTVQYPSLRLGLRLEHQGALASMARFFGAQDIELGDSAFDDAIVVKGRDERAVIAFLTPARRLRVQRLFSSHPRSVVTDESIRWTKSGMVTDSELIESTLDHLCSTARVLTLEPEADAAFERAIEARAEGRLDDALALVRGQSGEDSGASPIPRPLHPSAALADWDSRVVEGELLYASGRYAEAAEVLERARESLPEDAAVSALAERAAHKRDAGGRVPAGAPSEESGEPVAAPEPGRAEHGGSGDEPAAEPTTEPGPSVAELSGALFGERRMSFEVDALFDERFAGRTVVWEGELSRVSSYRNDPVFGQGPGAKAVLVVRELEGDAFGTRRIQAVVELPPEAKQELEGRRGERVRFEGRLARCDAFARNLYVAGGRLAD